MLDTKLQWSAPAVAATILAIVVLEMVFVLGVMRVGSAPIMGGDAWDYHNLALNLLREHTYSREAKPPFEPTMYRSPGYPLFLAIVYAVAGQSPIVVRIAQFALLAVTSFLVYVLGSKLASDRAAAIAAMLCAAYPPFIISACLHYSETLASFVTVLTFLLLYNVLTEAKPVPWTTAAAGFALGFSVLVRSFMVLMIVVIVVIVFYHARRNAWTWQRASQTSCIIFASAALVAGPWMIRNVCIADTFVPLGVTGGTNLWQGAEQIRGTIGYRMSSADWRMVLKMARDRYAEARSFAQAHPSRNVPLSIQTEVQWDNLMLVSAESEFRKVSIACWIADFPVRFYYLWSAADLPPESSDWLKYFLGSTQVLLGTLVVAGLVMSRKFLLEQWPLWILAAYLSTIFLPALAIEARYSLSARPLLLIYAGVALDGLFRPRS